MEQPKQPAQPSISRMMKDGTAIPSDLGLFPGTFVTPVLANRPSIFSAPIDRLRLEWGRIKTHGSDLIGLIVWKFTSKAPRPKLRFRQIVPTALGLHRQMYTAFADGDVSTLRKICTDGLLQNLTTRVVHRRAQKESVQWQLLKYIKSPRVVSNRMSMLPFGTRLVMRQAVVRIQSQQSLTKIKNGEPIPGTGEPQSLKEYLVIQQLSKDGKEGPWMIWGTTEETDLERLIFYQENPLGARTPPP